MTKILINNDNQDLKDLLISYKKLNDKIFLCNSKDEQDNADITINSTDDYLEIICSDNVTRKLPRPYRLKKLFSIIEDIQINQTKTVSYIGKTKFNFNKKHIANDQKQVDLTEKEAQILNQIILSQPKEISRESLLSIIWGYDKNIDTNTLEVHLYRLRKKMEELGEKIYINEKGYFLQN